MENKFSKRRAGDIGFSMLELMIVVVIILIVAGIAVPNILRGLREYRLNNAGVEISNLIQQTRFQAVRLNRNVTARATCPGVLPVQVWIDINNNGVPDQGGVDLNGDGVPDAQEGIVILTDEIVFGPGGAPGPGSMGVFYAPTATPPNCGAGPGTGITFNSRGAVEYGANPPVVYFLTLGYRTQPEWGYRGITLTPMGKTKLWKGTQGGAWVDR